MPRPYSSPDYNHQLLLTRLTDVLQIGDRQMSMLVVALAYARVMAHGLCVFFEIVHRAVIDRAGRCDGVAHMLRQRNGVAPNFPGTAVIARQAILVRTG